MSIKCTVCGALALPCLCGYMQMTNHPANNNDYSRGYSDGWQAATKQTQQPDESPTPNWLLASAQALLDLDASGSLVPHGIGNHARDIIQQFISAHRNVERMYNETMLKRESSDEFMDAFKSGYSALFSWVEQGGEGENLKIEIEHALGEMCKVLSKIEGNKS